MSVLRRAFLISALTLAAGSSVFAEPPPPARPAITESRPAAPVPSAEATAIKAALDTAEASKDPREEALLEDIRDFYGSRHYAPLWLGDRRPSPQMTELRRRMDDAAADGLDPAPYVTRLARASGGGAQQADADVEFSRAVARFVIHLSAGRIRPSEVSGIITLEPEVPQAGDILSRLSAAPDPLSALDEYAPHHPQYRTLRAKLAELHADKDDEKRIVVPEGKLLKPGNQDERVLLLRQRLGTAVAPDADPEAYDDSLVEVVKAFQDDNGLNADGILGPRTLVALNGHSREDDIAAIIANMERWRWMPRDLGALHVMVNVPEFMVRVMDDGAIAHETRVIVGTPKNRTPTFSHVMDHLVVNPFWNVPSSIVAEEMLPAVRRNRGYFSRGGYQVFARVRGRYRQVNSYWVDWRRVSARKIQVRQVPGDFNSLGRIKFMFPNQHSVYLHDTPSKRLFQRDQRAFSHGCVRVENPLAFADAILPVAAPEWNSTRLEKLYGGKERRINLDKPIPVHLAYFTISIDADGDIRRFEDIYSYDGETIALMQSPSEG